MGKIQTNSNLTSENDVRGRMYSARTTLQLSNRSRNVNHPYHDQSQLDIVLHLVRF